MYHYHIMFVLVRRHLSSTQVNHLEKGQKPLKASSVVCFEKKAQKTTTAIDGTQKLMCCQGKIVSGNTAFVLGKKNPLFTAYICMSFSLCVCLIGKDFRLKAFLHTHIT